jgi:hypothetical protein
MWQERCAHCLRPGTNIADSLIEGGRYIPLLLAILFPAMLS